MSVGQSKFYHLGALVLLISGFAVAVEGHPFGWLLAAIGGINSLLGILNLRKTQRRLSSVRPFRDHT